MKKNGLSFVLLVFVTFSFIACKKNTTSSEPASVASVNRLIFESDAESGGHLKMEIDDTHIESLLDGNTSGVTSLPISASNFTLPLHESLVKFTFTNVNYYGETISEVTCDSNPDSKFSLLWKGSIGSSIWNYYEGFNGYLYLLDDTDPIPANHFYAIQGESDTITSAAVADGTYFSADCTSADGEAYTVSFYPSDDVLSHSIQTTFSVEKGTIEGIVRLHRIGDGHVPPLDMLF